MPAHDQLLPVTRFAGRLVAVHGGLVPMTTEPAARTTSPDSVYVARSTTMSGPSLLDADVLARHFRRLRRQRA
jgi:hypothetical protein